MSDNRRPSIESVFLYSGLVRGRTCACHREASRAPSADDRCESARRVGPSLSITCARSIGWMVNKLRVVRLNTIGHASAGVQPFCAIQHRSSLGEDVDRIFFASRESPGVYALPCQTAKNPVAILLPLIVGRAIPRFAMCPVAPRSGMGPLSFQHDHLSCQDDRLITAAHPKRTQYYLGCECFT